MSTMIVSNPKTNQGCRFGLSRRRAWGLAVPLLVAGMLAAGCGSASFSSTGSSSTGASSIRSGGTGASSVGSSSTGAARPVADSTTAAGATVDGGPVHSTVTATPVTPVTPVTPTASVPTVSVPVITGGAACTGWPAGATSVTLPVSFVPVSVERCVIGVQTIPGKGLWTTATLQRSASDLSGLINALHQPAATRQPGTVCPAIATIPPQVVLVNAAGEKVIPRLPVGECGLTAAPVLAALNSLSWQPVSVRLIAPVPGVTATVPSAPGTAPHSAQSAGGVVHPG
jgi:hypothetical protein